MSNGDKAILRCALLAQAQTLTPAQRQESDALLVKRLLELPELAAAHSLLLFAGVGTEPDTAPLIEKLLAARKQLALPRVLPERQLECRLYTADTPLIKNRWDIPEPADTSPVLSKDQIELVLVPALCYDRDGYRLGHGGGYYDRFLENYHGLRVGLCRDVFLQDSLPRDEHDQKVQILLTESQVFRLM